MKILVVTRSHISDSVGGTNVYTHDLNRFLVKKGHTVTHICFSSKENKTFLCDNVKIIKFKTISQGNVFFRFFKRLFRFRRYIKKYYLNFQPDIIFIDGAITSQFLVKNKIPSTKIIYFLHAVHSHEIMFDLTKQLSSYFQLRDITLILTSIIKASFYYVLERLTLYLSESVVAMSQYDKAEVVKYHGKKWTNKIQVIPIGVDITKYNICKDKKELRSKYGIPLTATVFTAVRRLEYRMGIINLIVAFSKIKNNDVILIIAGKGSLKNMIESKIKELNMQNKIWLLGFIPENDKIAYIQCSDFMVLPSEDLEGFGITILESWACNIPIIGTPAGAIPENLRTLDSEFIAEGINADCIAAKMAWALENKTKLTDTNRYREHAERYYDWEIISDRIEKLITRQPISASLPKSRKTTKQL